MSKILEELWYGNVGFENQCGVSEDERKLMKYMADHHDNLYKTLNKQQKELLEKFDDCSVELNNINEKNIFVYGFRLGALIAFEVMNTEN
ncbi:MAG: hypothetical protein IJN15_03970 [Clostridia bacterium]|nr:hypothetical protein [Clostridia bacterium]